ncbi:MAG: macro domain-containing protein [Firmicutes bacterium]|nr:macro domain-containing protein [Bacillota bacterium]
MRKDPSNIKLIKGNLPDSQCQALINEINCDGIIGGGVQLEFRYRYPEIFRFYKHACENGKVIPGKLDFYYANDRKTIINFPTKNHSRQPADINYIKKGLEQFVGAYKDRGIKSAAFPRLGTDNDELQWDEVKKVMYKYLKGLNIKIFIYEYKPGEDLLFNSVRDNIKKLDPKEIPERFLLDEASTALLINGLKSKTIKSFEDLRAIREIKQSSIQAVYDFGRRIREKEIKIDAVLEKLSDDVAEQLELF